VTWKPDAHIKGPTTCTEETCERPHWSRGLCNLHYGRARKSGTLPPRIRVKVEVCKDASCEEPGYCRGFCRKHYTAFLRSGGLGVCSVDGCTQGPHSGGRCASHASRHRRYGLTDEEMAALDGQEVCDLCGVRPPEHVDHDHVTGKTRSFLCGHCNKGLGHFADDPDLLRRAADYIERHRALPPFDPS
jgi:hypothetical protein